MYPHCPMKFDVSIHVPLAEHDPDQVSSRDHRGVSIHVPLAEHDNRQK